MLNETQNRKDNIHLNLLVKIVKLEIAKLLDKDNYYGTQEQIDRENFIYDFSGIEANLKESLEEYYIRVYNTLTNK